MRAALYLRQSDTGGHGAESLSLASQETELRARCDREEWTVVAVESEPDLRGWQDETARPAFSRVLDAAARGDVDLVLVWDLSRLARSLEHQERWIRVLGRMGVEIVSHTEPHVRDTPLVRQVLGAVNEHRTREIQAHVRRAMRERAERCLTHGPAPFGYLREPRQPMRPDPDAAPIVARCFAMRVAGASTAEIRDFLIAVAPPPPSGRWRWESVHIMLRNPAYKGTVASGPVTADGCHEPIVDEATWQAAQRQPRRYRRRPDSAQLSWLSGLVDHGCGRPMHLHAPNPTNPRAHFRCGSAVDEPGKPRSCAVRPMSLAAYKVEAAAWEQALAALDRIGDPAAVLAAMRRAYRDQAPDASRERRQAVQAVARAEARRARAEELYLSGTRDRAWFALEDARAAAELAAARDRLEAMPRPPDRDDVELRLQRLRSLRDAAALMTPAQRGELVALLGRVVIAGRGDVRLALDPAVERLLA